MSRGLGDVYKRQASNTLEEVKHSMKIDYFENKNLLSKENER